MREVDVPPVVSKVCGQVGVVTINRPEVRNALNSETELAIEAAVRGLASQSEVRAVLINGSGSNFCSGVDLSRLGADPPPGGYNASSHLRFLYLTQLEKPVCAAIAGWCLGSGLALALHCDLRFAAPSARFKLPFADLGLVGEMGIPWLLTRLSGPGKAAEWLFSRRTVGSEEAQRSGLINAELAESDFEAQAVARLSDWVSGTSAHSLAVIKRQIWDSLTSSLAQAEYEAGAYTRTAIDRAEHKTLVAKMTRKLRSERSR